jgi:hypothetical protein
LATTATTLLSATGWALTEPRSDCGVRGESMAFFTRVATPILVTSLEAVSTSRVGSADSRISPRVLNTGSSPDTGVTRMSDWASYVLVAVKT